MTEVHACIKATLQKQINFLKLIENEKGKDFRGFVLGNNKLPRFSPTMIPLSYRYHTSSPLYPLIARQYQFLIEVTITENILCGSCVK